tara:strand:- start:1467 stop:2564 length:1098 start_codon:yes stop_codon:yes gene_type:complete
MTKTLTLLTIATLLFCASCSKKKNQAEYTIKWEIAHQPLEYFQETAQKFKELVEKRTEGKVKVLVSTQKSFPKIEVIDGAKYKFNNAGSLDRVLVGELDMSQIYTERLSYQISSEFAVLSVPYLLKNHEHIDRVVEGKIGGELLASVEAKGLKGLAFTYSGGEQAIVSVNRPVKAINDFKDIRYRGFSDWDCLMAKINEASCQIGSRLIDDRRLTLEQQISADMVDAGDATVRDAVEAFYNSHQRKAKYLTLTGHKFLMTALVFNKEKFNSFPKDIQQIILTSAREVARFERKSIIDDERKFKRKIERDNKFQVIEMTYQERSKLKDSLIEVEKKVLSQIKDSKRAAYLVDAIKNLAKEEDIATN